jgi:hypothetical protein
MPIYELLEYDARNNCHKVKDEAGVTRLVDVMVNGDFPEGTEPESIVGQKVECKYEYPYIAIAMHVRTASRNA